MAGIGAVPLPNPTPSAVPHGLAIPHAPSTAGVAKVNSTTPLQDEKQNVNEGIFKPINSVELGEIFKQPAPNIIYKLPIVKQLPKQRLYS